MQIKNKIILIIICTFSLSIFNSNLHAEEFNISALEFSIDQKNNIVIGEGDVEVTDSEGKLIKADKVTYEKSKEFLLAEESVEVIDVEGNILKSDKATYDKKREKIITYENSELVLKEGYKLTSNKILYNNIKKKISSNQNSILTDSEGNIVTVNMFQYNLEKNLFSSVGEIKIIDINKNKYFFKELHVDTKKREMIGSDVSVILDQENFGVSKESNPRFVANDIFMTKNISNLSKGFFTVCHKKEGRCPPWTLQAKKISHDKIKKTIYYEHATLKVYDMPIFYFPRFSHPDPTVKRASGFLNPFFTNSTSLGAGFGLPYYWAISHDKDLTFTPKMYAKENVLFLSEYRQAFRNAFLTLDTSYTEGYKNTSTTKTKGSRNHIFAELDFDFSQNQSYESKLSFKTQRTSNDTYFKIHDINTALVDAEKTDLENKISYNFSKDNMYLDISATVYENLREKTNDRYEYILPNILYGKTFFTEKFGSFDFKANAYHKNYETNKYITLLTNDVVWNPDSNITKGGFVNSLGGMIKNRNYEAKKTTDYKTTGTVNELSSVLTYKSSLPMQKKGINFSNTFTPNFMIRYAPNHMRNMSDKGLKLGMENLYSLNKLTDIDVVEAGTSITLGTDYNYKDKNDFEKFNLSVGQVFSYDDNADMARQSSLNEKTSELVGSVNYYLYEFSKFGYKFSLDNNFNDLNYNEISSIFKINKLVTKFEYVEENNHIGDSHYIDAGLVLELNKSNSLKFETRENFTTDATEFYNLSYQYENDCLRAAIEYNKSFYSDADLEPSENLMFTLTIIPFGKLSTPTKLD